MLAMAELTYTRVPDTFRSPEDQARFLTSLDRLAAYLKSSDPRVVPRKCQLGLINSNTGSRDFIPNGPACESLQGGEDPLPPRTAGLLFWHARGAGG